MESAALPYPHLAATGSEPAKICEEWLNSFCASVQVHVIPLTWADYTAYFSS